MGPWAGWTLVGIAVFTWLAGFIAGWAFCRAWDIHQKLKTQQVSEQYRTSEYRLRSGRGGWD